jgi:hypothetical protein
MSQCDLYNWTKLQPYVELHPAETPEYQWDIISIKYIVELSQAHCYDAIIVVINSVTKHAHLIPTHTTTNAEGVARLYLREVWKHYGLPREALLDRVSHFIAKFTYKGC